MQPLRIVNFGATEILHAEWIDDESDAIGDDFSVAILDFFIEGKSVLKTGTSATLDINTQN